MRVVVARENERNGTYCLHIFGNIVAVNAVAAGDALHELSVYIRQRNRQSIVFKFATHLEFLAHKSTRHLFEPLLYVLFVIGVGQRQHGIFVCNLPEFAVQVGTNALGWRVRIVYFGVLGFQVLQFVHHKVEILVAYCRCIQHVVFIVMLVKLLP